MAPVAFKRKIAGKERSLQISVKEVHLTRPTLFPNEARLTNATYAFTVSADLEVVGDSTITVPDVRLATIPAMVRSGMCLLSGIPSTARFEMGECRNDPGGRCLLARGLDLVRHLSHPLERTNRAPAVHKYPCGFFV